MLKRFRRNFKPLLIDTCKSNADSKIHEHKSECNILVLWMKFQFTYSSELITCNIGNVLAKSNIEIIQRFEDKVLRNIVDASEATSSSSSII